MARSILISIVLDSNDVDMNGKSQTVNTPKRRNWRGINLSGEELVALLARADGGEACLKHKKQSSMVLNKRAPTQPNLAKA